MFFESAFELHDERMLSPQQLSKKLHHTIVGSFVSSEEWENCRVISFRHTRAWNVNIVLNLTVGARQLRLS